MERKFIKGEKAYMEMPVEVKTIDKEAGTLEAIFSTQDVDRHGDVVLQEGWDLTNFKKNPVILNSHNYGDASEVIGKASGVSIDKKKLQGKITFAVNENPKAKVIFDLYAGGFLNAFSVGFIPSKFKENKDGSTDYYTIAEAELLEVSAVSVPANARALAKAKGIDIDTLPEEKNDNETDNDKSSAGPESESKPDEVSKDNEVQTVDEEKSTEDVDNNEGKPKADDEVTGQVPGDSESEGVISDKTDEVKASYSSKVVRAIQNIESEEKSRLKQVSVIINGLLSGDVGGQKAEAKIQDQIRKRKVNQAIRLLLKTK